MIEVVTKSVEGTKQLAQAIGQVLRGGEVLELVSDVGGGKTTFVKGLAVGLQIDEVVQSPTFTISRLYKARDGLELHHFDFYRLSEPGVVAAELAESLAQPNAVVAVEWGEIVEGVLPEARITIIIKSVDDQTRRLSMHVPHGYDYVRQAVAVYKKEHTTA